MNRSLQAALYARLEDDPARPAIGFMAASGEVSWRSREEFYGRAAAHAAWLGELGARRGDVCILVLPSEEFCATALTGTLLLGAIPLLIAPPLLAGIHSNLMRVLVRMIGRTNPRVVLCPESMAHMGKELGRARRSARVVFGEPPRGGYSAPVSLAAPTENDVAALQLTSGTTGFPRVCVWKQRHIVAALDGMAAAMKLGHDDICFNWTPLYHDMGLVNDFFLCMAKGVPLAVLSPQDFIKNPALWLRGLHATRATTTWSPNFGFAITAQRVRDDELNGVRLNGVRAFWNAAERIHLETMQAFHARFAPFGVRLEALKTNFGCAENVGGATFSDPDGTFFHERVDRDLLRHKGIARPVADSRNGAGTLSVVGVGRPVPGMQVRILSRSGRPLPDGHVGEVALKTPSRMAGFLGQTRETRRAVRGQLLRTGDLGYLRGQELFWVGRLRERITVRGRKIDPSDFEAILAGVAGVRHGCFAVFGVDDPRRGTQRVVIVAEVQDATQLSRGEISREIHEQVVSQLGVAVTEVVLVRERTLTKTSSGKRRHLYFRDLYLEGRLVPVP